MSEKLLSELNDQVKEIQDQIKQNRADLDRGLNSEEGRNELMRLRKLKMSFNATEFISKSFLFLIHQHGDDGVRPISVMNTDSTALSISQNNTLTNVLKNGVNNAISCVVRNGGDLHVPIVNVEFLLSKAEEYVFEGKITGKRELAESLLVSIKIIKGEIKVGDQVKIVKDGISIHTVVEEVSRNLRISHIDGVGPILGDDSQSPLVKLKIFGSAQLSVTVGDTIVNDKDKIYEVHKPFKFQVDDVFSITGRGTVITGTVLEGECVSGSTVFFQRKKIGGLYPLIIRSMESFRKQIDIIKKGDVVGLLVDYDKDAFKRGDFLIQNPVYTQNAIVKNVTAPRDIKEYDCLGIVTDSIAGHNTIMTTLELANLNLSSGFRYLAARAYSNFPIDLPDNFDLIDPSIDRHTAIRVVHIQ
ncbi:hypothetical protein [Sphingobacterium bovistauri]|uniref:Uncharacterized protein n=1 Tax=Sphingobacterium bovistauri TaxID=2781959 RepID=A0ABS7Z4N4_9SPHI|nr:hypothetical protein [Sphingobacterium bovistauri]MCA5005151.1 hypothetical protein [Sphingobacterium bovistauri]